MRNTAANTKSRGTETETHDKANRKKTQQREKERKSVCAGIQTDAEIVW